MKKNNPLGNTIVMRYAQAFCRVGQISKGIAPKKLASDFHFNGLAYLLAGTINRSKNTLYVLEDPFGNTTEISIGKPAKKVVCKFKGIELCYEKSRIY